MKQQAIAKTTNNSGKQQIQQTSNKQ